MKLLFNFLTIFAITINFLVIFLMIKKKNKELHDRILISIFIFLLALLTGYYSEINDITWLSIIVSIPVVFIEAFGAPTLLLYIKALFENPKELIKRNLIHYISIPIVFVLYVILIILFLDEGLDQKTKEVIATTVETIEICYALIYCFLSLHTLNNYRQKTKSIISSFDKHDVNWIRNLIIGFIIILVASLILNFPLQIKLITLKEATSIASLVIGVFLFYIAYYGIMQSKMLLPNFVIPEGIEESKTDQSIENKNNIGSLLTNHELTNIETSLNDVLSNKKPHLDADLTLHKLSSMLGISSKKLSFFLNKHQQKTFYDFINAERVKTVKDKINHPNFKNYTLLAIAYESGFNSKTTFNRIFKKETGISPSEYRNRSKQ